MTEPERILPSREEPLLPCQVQSEIIQVQERESEAVTREPGRILPSRGELSLPSQMQSEKEQIQERESEAVPEESETGLLSAAAP